MITFNPLRRFFQGLKRYFSSSAFTKIGVMNTSALEISEGTPADVLKITLASELIVFLEQHHAPLPRKSCEDIYKIPAMVIKNVLINCKRCLEYEINVVAQCCFFLLIRKAVQDWSRGNCHSDFNYYLQREYTKSGKRWLIPIKMN